MQNSKKVVCAVLLVAVMSLATLPVTAKTGHETPITEEPRVDILKIHGGFGITVVALNNCSQDLTNVSWEMAFEGGHMLKGKTVKSEYRDVNAGETFRFLNMDSRGFGQASLTLTICYEDTTTQYQGPVFFMYNLVFILK
jgi:hypothetical protein